MIKSSIIKDSKYYLSILFLMVLVCVLVIYFYGPVFFNPNEYLFNDTGDTYKNYFTYEWHIHNDYSFIDYSGSNYPFGENHLYTDGTPLLGNLIKILPFLKPYSIGIFNFSMLLSLFICALVLFKMFKLFDVENWKAVLSSLGITILCPQALRYEGHFALSYGFCIPLIIYLLVKYNNLNNDGNFKQSIIIAFASFLFFFIHPYIGMICSSFCFLFWLFKLLIIRKTIKKQFLFFLLQAIMPLVAYFVIVKLTDSHVDRNLKPYGFFYFTSSIETVFISTHKPFRHLLSQLYKITSQNGEGIAYVGISSLIVIIICTFFFFRNRKQFIDKVIINEKIKLYGFMILSSVVLLFFSMGFPFNFKMEWMLDYITLIQQFRSPGRFAWVFYFIISISSCIVISRYLFISFYPFFRNVFILVLLLLYTVEGIPYHNSMSKKQFPKNVFNELIIDEELKKIIKTLKTINPQAIIPLPFFHIGTDYYNISGTEKITNTSFVVSLHSKIPLMANLTPRNSLTEAEKLIQIISNDVLDKTIKNNVKSHKPFAILYNKEELSEEEMSLLNKGVTILETEHYILKSISFQQLFYNSSENKLKYFEDNKSNMIVKNDCYLTSNTFFVHNTYDELPNKRYQGNVNDTNIVYEIKENELQDNEIYEISFWYTASERLDMNNLLVVSEKDNSGNYEVISKTNVYSMPNVYKGSSLVKATFKCKTKQNKINISLTGISDREKIFFIDDLIIKQKNVDVYFFRKDKSFNSSSLVFNNFELSN